MIDTLGRLASALADRYRVDREIGAGGMATVYLAQDLKHDRDVAIKVLHPDLGAALGGERFLAEIKTTAKLQHPHILPLLDSGEAGGLLFYVMPLVEGETLRARLTREKQLPIDVAMRIATEVAGALDYAHRHGVIHRDIKPENILLHDGRAVVADFGIALAVTAAGGSRMTQTGLSLGTPQYMSPEQAMGEKVIDARSDIYALGAVLFEMLTGEPPFSGATVQAIVAKVLTEKPMHPTAVRDTIPMHVETTLLKALAKLPADRFATAAQFADALARPEATAGIRATAAALPAAVGLRHGARRTLPWVIAAASVGALLWTKLRPPVTSDRSGSTVLAELPPVKRAVPVMVGGSRLLAMSADGSRIAFLGVDSTRIPQLFVRSVGTESVWSVPESQFGFAPALSRDGQWLAFAAVDGLQVIQVGETRPRILQAGSGLERQLVSSTAWEGDSAVLFTKGGGLYRMRANGGAPQLVAEPPDSAHRLLGAAPTPDGRAILVAVVTRAAQGSGRIGLVRPGSTTVEDLGIPGVRPQLVQGDILAFFHDAAIRAVRVDPLTFRPVGEPVVLVSGAVGALTASFALGASTDGLIAFVLGASAGESDLLLVDRTGRERVLLPQRQAYRFPRFSPAGDRLAFGVSGDRGVSSGDIWTLGLADGKPLRVTADGMSYHPVWWPDGKSLLHLRRDSVQQGQVFRTLVDGTSPPAPVLTKGIGSGIWEMEPTPDLRTLIYRIDNGALARDIFAARLDSGPAPAPLVQSRFDEKGIALAPDGKWLAYSSDEAGASDVYIRRVDPGSPRWRVSEGGGVEPRWAKSGELFFRRGDSVMVARVNTARPEPQIAPPQFVLRGEYVMTMFEPVWDVSPDGKRFAFVRSLDSGNLQLMVLFNWTGQVRRGAAR